MSVCFSQSALAEKRVALVIGISKYQNVNHLANPDNDTAMLAATFRKAKFDVVTLRTDLTAAEMRRTLRHFSDQARDADIAVIYYAGHGIEVDGTNYVVPADARLQRDTDVYDEAISVNRLLVAIEPAKRLRLIILDACRNDPFTKTMKRMIARRAIGRGLVKVEPANPNTMIAFAAKAGSTAEDGDGKDSPFAMALAAHLTTPGLDLRRAFGYVRDDVLKATSSRQEPFIYGSLGGDEVSLVPASPVAKPRLPLTDPNEAIRRDYLLAEQVGTREAWHSFLASYGKGFYAKLAKAQLDKLAAEAARIAATEKAKAATDEQARLAAEGAAANQQKKALAVAKAAEAARIAAEKKLVQAEARAKAADEARIAAEKAMQERIAKAEAEAKAAAAKAEAIAQARGAVEQIARDKPSTWATAARTAAQDGTVAAKPAPGNPASQQLASLTPAQPAATKPAAAEVPRLLLVELRRVGCFTGSIEGTWNDAAQQSLGRFNKYAGTTLDTKLASLDTLDVVRGRHKRVCPLACDHGYKAEGDTCTRIICRAGSKLKDNNECEKIERRKQQAKRETPEQSRQRENGRANQNGGGGGFSHRCRARSCSMALHGCMRIVTMLGKRGRGCEIRYHACLQSGNWAGHMCNMHGLARN
ncbi:MAG: caspase family protein [Bradyrhizobium sp.]